MGVNWGVNGIIGLTVSLFTYYFSYTNNTWQTSLLRAVIGFLLFFVLSIVFQLVLQQVDTIKKTDRDEKQNHVDRASPKPEPEPLVQDDEVIMEESSFQAFSLDALHSSDIPKDSEITVQTIRTWNKQNQEG